MLRLILSLFFALAMSLGFTAWLFESDNHKPDQMYPIEQALIEALFEQVKDNLPNGKNQNVGGISVSNQKLSSIFLPDDMFNALKSGQIVSLVNENNEQLFYRLAAKQTTVTAIGPFKTTDAVTAYSLTFLFYIAVAFSVIVCCWPLIKDLNRLRVQCVQIGLGHFQHSVNFKQSSMIKNIGDTFDQMSDTLNQQVNAQRELINAVSHDFLTPISRIKFALETMPEYHSVEKTSIIQDTSELEILIDEFLTYAELSQCKPQFSIQQYECKELIQPIIDKFTSFSDIEISLGFLEESIAVDARSFNRILQNLLGNAVRFSTSKVQISITLSHSKLFLVVEDDGAGIPKKIRSHFLKSYTQQTPMSSVTYKGVGLGLSIVKQLTEWQQGKLTIDESKSLGGASFIVMLPISTA